MDGVLREQLSVLHGNRAVAVRPFGYEVFRGRAYGICYPHALLKMIRDRNGIEREDDMRFVVLSACASHPMILAIVVRVPAHVCARSRTDFRWLRQWEVRSEEDGPKYVAAPYDVHEERPDTIQEPRQQAPSGIRVGFHGITFRSLMMVMGIDNLVIPTSAEGPPPVGLATQFELFFPRFSELRLHPAVKLGSILICRVGTEARSSVVYLPITRTHGRDLEVTMVATECWIRIGNDAMRRGIRQLGIHRPPAHELANWFESAVVARLLLPEQVDAAIFPGSTGYSGRWMPRKWQSPMDKGMIGGRFLHVG